MKLRKWVLVSTLIFVICGAVVAASWHVNQRALSESALEMARIKGQSAFQLVQTMRQWNSQHGGLYAPLTPDSPANLYLDLPDRDITDESGRRLTKINPAYMTRQLSNLLNGSDIESQLTSLKPINPINRPDYWEKQALLRFEQGATEEVIAFVAGRYRYIAPLFVEESCLACHEHQGYAVGDVRGGLGFSFPASQINALVDRLKAQSNQTYLLAFATIPVSGVFVFFIVGILTQRLRQTSERRWELEVLVRTDGLTGVLNRRAIAETLRHEFNRATRQGAPLSVLMLDLDRFKQVNDMFGHSAGDAVLRTFADIVQSEIREIDYVGRYGGEEFMVLLPDTDTDRAVLVGERIRARLQAASTATAQHAAIKVTVSIGIAERNATPCTCCDTLVELADQAMYHAKHHGRNRVSVAGDAAHAGGCCPEITG